ncbi:hypothetical protein BH11ACT3_BH11ACT3_02970 [soil metagenome]
MTDERQASERPRPQYGEYATPAEVAEARGPDAPPIVLTPSPTARAADPVHAPVVTGATRGGRAATSSRWDRPLTFAFLALGVVNVLGSIPVYLDFARSLRTSFSQLGFADLKLDGPQLPALGIALLVIDSLLILVAIGLSAWLMRRGRRAVWVPLAAFVVHQIVQLALLLPIVLNDPGYAAVMQNLTQ